MDAAVGDPGQDEELGARVTGNLTKLGVPHPDHRPGQSHPVQSVEFKKRVAAGQITPKPGIDRLEERSVVFTDGTSAPADLIVWATGYRVTFPFLDPALVAAPRQRPPAVESAWCTPTCLVCTSSGWCRRSAR